MLPEHFLSDLPDLAKSFIQNSLGARARQTAEEQKLRMSERAAHTHA